MVILAIAALQFTYKGITQGICWTKQGFCSYVSSGHLWRKYFHSAARGTGRLRTQEVTVTQAVWLRKPDAALVSYSHFWHLHKCNLKLDSTGSLLTYQEHVQASLSDILTQV